jgi:hypothetical protein
MTVSALVAKLEACARLPPASASPKSSGAQPGRRLRACCNIFTLASSGFTEVAEGTIGVLVELVPPHGGALLRVRWPGDARASVVLCEYVDILDEDATIEAVT